MLRRKPTRIELKIEDISEWTAVRKERENKPDAVQTAELPPAHKSKRELIHERIGYEARPARETTLNMPRPLH
jgi:Anaphase-promoting complex APC subunit CDC26